VLIDVEMPRRSGVEVLAALRQDENTRATRVVLTSAGVRLAAVDVERVARADDFVTKPFEPDQLVKRVRAVLLPAAARGVNLAQSPNLTEPASRSAREEAVLCHSERGEMRS
jgi:DNA-binding response OmpR family regulator